MRYRVRHETSYRYDEPVALNHNAARLLPRSSERQVCFQSRVTITPKPAVQNRFVDYFGNEVLTFSIQHPHHSLRICTESEVHVAPRGPIDVSDSPPWESLARLDTRMPNEVIELRFESPLVPRAPELFALARPHFTAGRPALEAALALNHEINRGFAYDPEATTVATPVLDVLANRRGVCQDFSQVLLGALRTVGLAARYVSGYLETSPPPGHERLVGADASHAWVQVYCGEALGFVDLDPTNDCIPDDQHVKVAYGRDFSDVSPVKGLILGGGRTHVHVGVDIERLAEPDAQLGR